ncbi:uncharacterized protein BJ212DRAFT_1581278 [Suillus subaureus]|uniref:Large ribosomal subunit protein bL21m n=1 Tax=Suillus subaureus TaxID=48587 RepID=A0A9P7DUB8_9AGAM|nr:uncharacterized protein BJ212DRAFT_1581278 [Suillus subaureus]KAG1803067.1 hypothetical protein BJ212DRAFT_1581278 [Suillus subaureus]
MASWQIRNWLSNNLRRVASCSVSTQAALPKNTCAAFSLIRSQPSQYIVASLAGRKYLLAPRDLLTVPHLKDVHVGDVLALQDIHEVGSRDSPLRGDPIISPSRVKVEATVVEHTKGKMEVVFKKKRKGLPEDDQEQASIHSSAYRLH